MFSACKLESDYRLCQSRSKQKRLVQGVQQIVHPLGSLEPVRVALDRCTSFSINPNSCLGLEPAFASVGKEN